VTQTTGNRRLGDALDSIAVLRALQLGDLLCAVPAWRALRGAYPGAHIALIGLPWAREFAARFHRYFDEFIEFPGFPGLPERQPVIERIPPFIAGMQRRRFHCLLQMQGSGHHANELVALCGAQSSAGYYAGPEFCPDPNRFLPYPEGIPEVKRHLRLMQFLGIPAEDETLEFPLTEEDDAEFRRLDEAPALAPGSYICLHPGGRRPANRWTPENFAAVADRLAAEGLRVALTGTASEQPLGEAVARAMRSGPVNLIGRTTLGSLGVLLSRARLLVSNDTGISHMAAALGVPSVVICINSDPLRWSPLNRRLHRVLVGHDTAPDAAMAEADALLHAERGRAGEPVQDTARESVVDRPDPWVWTVRRRPLRILTWHVHGNYLYYLSQTPHEFLLPVGRSGPGYAGCAPGFPWPANVREVAVADLPQTDFDCILFQSQSQYLVDQYELLTPEHFNRLMWNSRRTPTRVIEHGVLVPAHLSYSGELEKGLVVVNHLQRRGRRVGADLFDYVRRQVPLDLAGMDSIAAGGLGDIGHAELPALMCRYRFVFHPIRYTSLGLALCEAMALGVPPVALATTEAPTVIEHRVSGYIDTDVDALIGWMQHLLSDPDDARRIGAGAQQAVLARFGIDRFAREWDRTLTDFVGSRAGRARRAVLRDAAPTEALS
jgi:ADP-heptose:LPS heptosyltransferase